MADKYITRRYNWGDVPTLKKMYLSDQSHQFAVGPYGSGKSSACVAKIIKVASEQNMSQDGIRRSRWAIVRNTAKELTDTTIKTVKYWLPEGIPGNVWHESKQIYYVNCFPDIQIELLFRALDRQDQVKDLLSLELTGAWLNEFREIHRDIYEAMDGRVGRYPAVQDGGCKWSGIIADSNPPNKRSYWYNLFELKRTQDPELAQKIGVWKQPSGLSSKAENLPNLPKNYYKNLAVGKDQLYIDVYIHGLYGYTREGKPVFDLYNDNWNVSSIKLNPITGVPCLMGWDFALNPTVIIAQLLRGQLIILDEVEGENMGIDRMIDTTLMPLLHTRYRGFTFSGWGDPSGSNRSPTDESTCYDSLRTRGFSDVTPATTNALSPRLGAVNSFLSRSVGRGEPALLISPHCSHLREALAGGYHFKLKDSSNDEYGEEPVKNYHSHICDALEALCLYVNEGGITSNKKNEHLRSLMSTGRHRPADAVAGY